MMRGAHNQGEGITTCIGVDRGLVTVKKLYKMHCVVLTFVEQHV